MWGDIAIAFLLAFITAYVITPYTIRFAKKIGALDVPKDKRKIHDHAMPRLRRFGSNSWFSSFYNIFVNYNVYGRNYKYYRTR